MHDLYMRGAIIPKRKRRCTPIDWHVDCPLVEDMSKNYPECCPRPNCK
uniref:Venom peptide U2-SYTX-Sth1a n=1 Tax=Scytodes thoracica TaxID=1112478 RepID=A0A0A0V6Z6_SCYTH|nr:venom peptide U2-SYTX-Sth1a [Scytodes thoracica]